MDRNEYKDIQQCLKSKNVQKRIDSLSKKYKDKKVIIYGAGLLSLVLFDNYDFSKLNIIAVVDNKFKEENDNFKTYKGISPSQIVNDVPDVILLATTVVCPIKIQLIDTVFTNTGNIKVETIIKNNLTEKINDFFKFFPL